MPKIKILDLDRTIETEEGTSLLDACLDHDIEIDHACGGVCACSTCHVWIEEGMDNLNEASEDEEDRLEGAKGVNLKSRLSCQCLVEGDIVVKFPPQKGLH